MSNPYFCCLLYTSDAADERSSVDLGGRRIIKKKKKCSERACMLYKSKTDGESMSVDIDSCDSHEQ